MTLYIHTMMLVSVSTGHADILKIGKERSSMQWQKWLIILATCHMTRVIKLHQR